MKKQAMHPSEFIDLESTYAIRQFAREAEELGMLHPEQLAVIARQGWFKLLVPWLYGGLERSLPALVRLQEGISWADGSTGWVVTLCCGAGWFGGFMWPKLAQQVFNTPNVCLAGSGAPTGQAEITPQGYRISGQWNYATGAHHATHFTMSCIIKDKGQTVLDDKGHPSVLPFILDKKDVTLLPTWKYIGMIATGSHSFKVENVEVSSSRCFHIDAAYAEVPGALYQYPFIHLAEATLAANLSGMAVHFIDLCRGIIEEKQCSVKTSEKHKHELKKVFDTHEANLQQARHLFYTVVDASWRTEDRHALELQAVSHASRLLAKTVRTAVDTLYPYCGLRAAAPDTELNRVWRDLHTASQHSLLVFEEA